MEWMCGAFRPDLLPEWFSKAGPGLAALVAVTLYGLNRWHAWTDLRAKRKVLRVMLGWHIRGVQEHAGCMLEELGKLSDHPASHWVAHATAGRFSLLGVERLIDLQSELLGVAARGDEFVADFIEQCRSYRYHVEALAKHETLVIASDANRIAYDKSVNNVAQGMRTSLIKLREKAQAALEHLYRVLPSG